MRPPKDQGMNVMSTFIGVHGFQIHHMTHDVILVGNAVTAMHISGHSGDIQGLSAIVTFDQGNILYRAAVLIQQPAYT